MAILEPACQPPGHWLFTRLCVNPARFALGDGSSLRLNGMGAGEHRHLRLCGCSICRVPIFFQIIPRWDHYLRVFRAGVRHRLGVVTRSFLGEAHWITALQAALGPCVSICVESHAPDLQPVATLLELRRPIFCLSGSTSLQRMVGPLDLISKPVGWLMDEWI
jgi:hypothetical protein